MASFNKRERPQRGAKEKEWIMMRKVFAMVMMTGTCTLAENVITKDTTKEIALENGIVQSPWD